MNGIPVLLYHRVPRNPAQRDAMATPLSDFQKQMAYLRDAGYTVISLDTLASLLQSRREPTQPTVVLTFDDGYANTLALVDPILDRYGFTATLFLSTGLVGVDNPLNSTDEGPLTWEHLRALRRFRVQSHGVTHARLSNLSADQLAWEVEHSREQIGAQLGVSAAHFAYPYGAYTSAVKQAVIRAGYRTGLAVHRGLTTPDDDPYQLHRVIVNGRESLDTFVRKLQTGFGSRREAIVSRVRDAVYSLPLTHNLVEFRRSRFSQFALATGPTTGHATGTQTGHGG